MCGCMQTPINFKPNDLDLISNDELNTIQKKCNTMNWFNVYNKS